MLFLNNEHVYGPAFRLLCQGVGLDYNRLAVAGVKSLRGFPNRMFERLRQRPSQPLLRLLHKRIVAFDRDNFAAGTARGDLFAAARVEGVEVPGLEAWVRNYWLFPILVEDPNGVCAGKFVFVQHLCVHSVPLRVCTIFLCAQIWCGTACMLSASRPSWPL